MKFYTRVCFVLGSIEVIGEDSVWVGSIHFDKHCKITLLEYPMDEDTNGPLVRKTITNKLVEEIATNMAIDSGIDEDLHDELEIEQDHDWDKAWNEISASKPVDDQIFDCWVSK